jgi:hypothetical protein
MFQRDHRRCQEIVQGLRRLYAQSIIRSGRAGTPTQLAYLAL